MSSSAVAELTGPGPDEIYRQSLRAGKFQIQQCADCRKSVFYPRVVCPHCGGLALNWVTPSGRGTVYSTTVIRRKPEHGGDYNVAVVELEEGPRLMTRIDNVLPEQVRIGMAVSARITGSGEESLLIFVPAQEAASR